VPCKGEVKKRQKRPYGGGGSVRHLRQGNLPSWNEYMKCTAKMAAADIKD